MSLNIRSKIILISAAIFFLAIGANTLVNSLYFNDEYSKALKAETFIIFSCRFLEARMIILPPSLPVFHCLLFQKKQKKLIQELQEAFENIKTLSGLV